MESLASSLKAERNCSNCSNNERGQHSPIDAIPIAHNHELIYLDNTQKDHDDCVNNINASSMPSHSKESLHELPSSSLTADVISTEASCASDMIVSENAPYEYCDNKHVDRHLHPLASPQLPPTNQCLLQKCATAATATTTATAATYSTTTATRSTTTQAHSAIVTTTTTTTVAIATTSKVVATTDGEAQQVGVVEQKVTPHSNNNTDGVLKSVSSPLFSKPQITTNSEHTTMTMASTISSSSLSDATSNAPTIEILPCKSSDSNNHFVTRNWKDKYDCIEPNYDDDDGTNDHLNDARCNNELLVHRDVDEERESAVVEVNDCVTENDIREVPRVAARRNSYNYPSSNEEVTIVPPSWSCSAVPACILYPDSGDNNDSKERSKRYPSSDGGGEDDESHISWFINVFPHHNVFELMSTSSTLDGEPMPCTHASFKRKEKEDSKLNPCNEDDGVLSKNEWSGDDDDDDDDDDGADADDKVNEESHAFSVLVTELSTLISSDRQEEQEVIFFDHNDNCNYNDANGNDFDYDDDDDDDDDHDNDDDGDDNGDDDDDKRKLHEAEQDTTIQQITGVEKEKEVAELDNEEPAAAHATENDNITDGNDGNENIVSTGDLFLMVTETLTTLPQMLCITPREQHLLIHEEVSDDIHEDNESDNKNAQQIPDEVPPLAISTKQKKFFGNDERPSVSCNESIELFSMVTDACSTPVSQMIGLASTGNCLPIREKSSDSTTYTLPWHEFQIPTMQSEAEESSSSNDNIIVKDNTIEVELSADSKSCDQQDTVLVVDAVVRALRKTKNTPKISKGNSATHELLAVDSGPPYLENFSDPPPPSPDAMNVLMSLTRMEWCGRKQNLVTIPELPGTESSVTIESVGEDDALVMRDACHQSTSESPSRDDTMGSDSFSIDGFPFKLSLEHAKDKPKQTDTMRLSRSKKSMVLMVPLRRENASDGNSITDTPFHELSSTVSASFEFVPSLSDDRIPSPPQNTKELIVASNMLCQESGAAEEYLSFSSSPPQTIFVLPTDGLPFQAKGLNNTIGSSRLIQDQHAIPSPNHQPPTKPSKKKSNISGHHLHLLPPLSPAPRTTPRAKDASPKIPSSGFFFSDRDARFDDTDTCSSISGNEVNVSLSLSLSDECPIPPSPKHTDPIFSPTTNSGGNTNTEGDSLSLSLSLSLSMSFSEDSDPISQSRSKRTPNDNALETDPNVLDVTTSLARKGRTKVVPHLAINETLRNTKSSLMKFGRSRPRARPGTPRFPFIIFPSITEEPSLGQMTEDSLRLGRKSFSSPSSSPSSYAYHNKVGYAETDDGFNEEQENQSSRARDGMHATEGPNNLRVSKRRPRSAVLTKGILKAERAYNDKKTTRVTSARRRSVHWDEKQLSTKVEKGIMCLPPRNKNKLSPRRPAYALQRLLHEITAVQDGYGKGLEMFSSFPQRPQGYIC